MVRKGLKVNMVNLAKAQLKRACAYIRKDAPKNSLKVKKDILSACLALSLYPEKYPPDKYKLDNDGTYRAFELHHYRIVYRVMAAEIKILTLRHTSMEPMEY